MNVLIIPEDFRKDQYILKPVVKAMLVSLGKPNANVRILTDPLLGGIGQALSFDALSKDVLSRYRGMVDLFLLLVDRDGDPNRRNALKKLEASLNAALPAGKCLLAECAFQEIEVWALAAADLPKDWVWSEIRAHNHPKEAYFEALARTRQLMEEPGEGRVTMGSEAGTRWGRLRQLCPELKHLELRVSNHLNGHGLSGEPFDP